MAAKWSRIAKCGGLAGLRRRPQLQGATPGTLVPARRFCRYTPMAATTSTSKLGQPASPSHHRRRPSHLPPYLLLPHGVSLYSSKH